MKCMFILLSILPFIAPVLCEIKAIVLCPQECAAMQSCIDTLFAGQKKYKVKLYPPKEDPFGKCNCQDIDSYTNCMNCYFVKNGNGTVTTAQVSKNCENILSSNSATSTQGPSATPIEGNNSKNIENFSNKDNNSLDNNEGEDENSKGSSVIGIGIVGAVAVVGVVGYIVYSRKKKERPESMPFFSGNTISANSSTNAVQENANYESRRESILPGIQPTAVNVVGNFVVAYKYDPQLDDELALHIDDQIQIIEEYEDGWMKAYNITTGQEGMAPRVCIKEVEA